MADNKSTELGRTRSGFQPNVAAALSYALTVATGTLIFVIEKENKYARFHALQAVLFGASWIIFWILASIGTTMLWPAPVIGLIISDVILFGVVLGGFVVWLFLLYKAYRGARYKL
ncbi:MAG: DUF4870 domain-containing protein, partial [Nitrospirota bacterium]